MADSTTPLTFEDIIGFVRVETRLNISFTKIKKSVHLLINRQISPWITDEQLEEVFDEYSGSCEAKMKCLDDEEDEFRKTFSRRFSQTEDETLEETYMSLLKDYAKDKKNLCISEISQELDGLSDENIEYLLKKLNYVEMHYMYVPTDVTPQKKLDRLKRCEELLEIYEKEPLIMNRIIFVDEFNLRSFYPIKDETAWRVEGSSPPKKRNKRISDKKRSTLIATLKGVIVNFRVFEEKESINGNLFLDFIKSTYQKCKDKDPLSNFIFMWDDAGHHRKASIQQWLNETGSEHVEYPSYSADMFPPDYDTIKRIIDYMPKNRDLSSAEILFYFNETVKKIQILPHWNEFELPYRWKKIVELKGDYLPDAYHDW